MTPPRPRILVIEDEPSQVTLLRFNLLRQGFDVAIEMDGQAGLNAARANLPDLILLDWMLPSLSGVDVCQQLRSDRKTSQIPIIMLTARSEERDKVHGLEIGADDYVTKPYSVKELIARVHAALRRPAVRDRSEKLIAGSVEVDLNTRRAVCNGTPILMSAVEYRLLVTLMQNAETVFSREQLLEQVWGISAGVETRTVDVHIARLRRILKDAGAPALLRTARGFGYAFQP